MTALRQDLKVEQGADFRFVVDVALAGAPASIAGFTARMQVREYKEDDVFLAEFTTENGSITVNGSTSQVVLSVPAADTADFEWPTGLYDLVLTGGGKSYRLMEGRLNVSPSVTR